MAKTDLTVARLRELMHYDPSTGVFTWREKGRKHKAGEPVGHRSDGYLITDIDYRGYKLHRLSVVLRAR